MIHITSMIWCHFIDSNLRLMFFLWITGLTTHSKNRATWLLSFLTWRWSERKAGRLPKIDPNFNVSFPTTPCSPTLKKTKVGHNDLKKDGFNEFGLKYWTSNPVWVNFQEHVSSFYVNIEEKVWLLVKKIRTWRDWQGDKNFAFWQKVGDFIETKAKKSPTSPGLVSPGIMAD
jgi:hypothetical protein